MRAPVDGGRAGLTATGNVGAAPAWAEAPDGSRRRVGQAKTDAGVDVWEVEVMRPDENFGRPVTVVELVTVPAAVEPAPAPMAPIRFRELSVTVNPRKSGGLSVRWDATAIEKEASEK